MTFAIPLPPRLCLHFPCKFEWSPLCILPKFSLISPFGFSVTSVPPFCSPKNQYIHPKILRPPPSPPHRQAINNDRSLTVSQREAMMMAASFEVGQFNVICCHFCVSKLFSFSCKSSCWFLCSEFVQKGT